MNTKTMFSSKTAEWETPQLFFDALNAEFHFTIDVAANSQNHKCERYFCAEQNGLVQNWEGEQVWCNPPYGREIGSWVEKAYMESQKPNTTIVMLLPARTDTKWFHNYIYGKADIRFVKGRLVFGKATSGAPFPSMVAIYK